MGVQLKVNKLKFGSECKMSLSMSMKMELIIKIVLNCMGLYCIEWKSEIKIENKKRVRVRL